MSKTIIILGFGPGVSSAVAEKFGGEGFSVALVARSQARLTTGVEALQAKGVAAAAFPADLADPTAVGDAIAKARASLGPIGVVHWNAFNHQSVGDLLTLDPATLKDVFDLAVVGLVAAVQAALADLKADPGGAVLVTNGAFADANPVLEGYAVALKAEGVALAAAAKAKLVGLLAGRLKAEGVYVGEVTIAGAVKGTGPETPGVPLVEGATVADAFWDLYRTRGDIRARAG